MMSEHDAERDRFYRDATPACDGPLEGIRVLDVTTTWAGPRCSGVLADYGAEVIKIELRDPPEVARRLPPMLPDIEPPESYFNATVNKNKKNLCLDLRKAEGREVLLRLAETADVFVENFKKGTLASWGCGYEDLSAVNPEIVYVSITGFGQYGPYSHLPGYDPTAQAMSGFMHMNAQEDEAMPLKAPVFLADEIAGLHGAMAALAALAYRQREGKGQHVDIALLDAMIDSCTGLHTLAARGVPTPRLGNTYSFAAPANAYRCSDGWVHAGALLDSHWQRITRMLGRPELAEHPDYATISARLARRDEVDGILADWCSRRTREEVIRAFEQAQVVAAAVLTPAETVADPHVRARGAIGEVTTDRGETLRLPAPAAKFARTPVRIRVSAPRPGSHTESILEQIGYDAADIRRLARAGVI
jgi:formyl-CoA transferase